MKYPLYCIRDVKAGFDFPFPERSDATAIRTFNYQINKVGTQFNMFPKDYDLYRVGEFDTDKGVVISDDIPILVVNGVNMIGEPK